MRYLGIDVGTERTGIALSDETGIIAGPLGSIKGSLPPSAVAEKIAALCLEHNVATVVIGLPLSLSGQEKGESARRSKKIGALLEEKTEAQIVYWDERFSTTQAERTLIDSGVRRAKRRQVIDKVSAALILQSYLDSRGI